MLTIQALKAQAKRLRAHLETRNIHLSHSQALEAVAAAQGFRDWRTASGMLPAEEPGTPVAAAESQASTERRPSEKTSLALVKAMLEGEVSTITDALADVIRSQIDPGAPSARETNLRERQLDALEEPMRDDLLQQIADIERMGPPGIVDSARQMLAALNEKRLPEPVAARVGRYLFGLPGFRAGRRDDAEALHQQLLALRSRGD